MKSRLASIRSTGGVDRVNRAVQLLEDEWQRHGEVQFKQFWTQARGHDAIESVSAVGLLAELVKADLRCRFAKGQTPAVVEYLEQFPELRAADSRVLSLVYEEYCLNEERGSAPDVESFCDRYPDWKSSLVSQLRYHHLFSQAAGKRPSLPRFPEAGQDFEEFRLLSLLGTGGMSRVFLAKDLSLGGKHVVLKVALDRGQEPKVQGPLDHPHIVPVNSVVYPANGDLCGLSMPYRPGLSLDKLMAFIEPARRPRKAVTLWQELQLGTRYSANPPVAGESSADSPAGELPSAPRGDGWEGFPLRGTYAQGVAWIVMIVARALHYAHGKQTLHRDVKPGNILVTLQKGPQLLDFNLAESPHSADHAQAALHGGTLPYMAPEQIEAFINPDLWDKVGARADIYSLGLVFRELLTGQRPELPDPAVPPARALHAVLDRRSLLDPSVRRFNPSIPHALEAIIAKCLSASPDDRYADAQALEEDLDGFLKHQPLKHVINPSRRERLGDWVTRKSRALGTAACLLFVCAVYPVIQGLKPPPIETTPAFLSAVRLFDMGESATVAVETFKSFEAKYPDSSIVKFYLGYALKASLKPEDEQQYDVDPYLRTALGAPDVEKSATAWVKDHPRFNTYLVDFAESRIWRTDNLAKNIDRRVAVGDVERDREVRLSTYQLAMGALRLAAKLNPGSVSTQHMLAKTEQHFGLHDTAYERLSGVIDSYASRTNNDMLFKSRELRGWVACKWAEKDLEMRKANSDTRVRLMQAEKDYDYCFQYLQEHDFRGNQVMTMFFVLQHSLRTKVALAEVELEIPLPNEAGEHLVNCRESARQLANFIESRELDVPSADKYEPRIKEAFRRLQQDVKSDTGTNGRK